RFQLSAARVSLSWKVMRVFSRCSTTLFRGEADGPLGFFRWIFSRFLPVKFEDRRSYDPFADLDDHPLNAVEAPLPIPLPQAAEDVEVLGTEIEILEPNLLIEGRSGSGDIDVVIPVKGALHW